MALEDNGSSMVMPVSPMGGYGNGGGFGGFGGDGWWLILLLLCFGNNGWGGFGGGANAQLGYDFPWLLNGQNNINANTNDGFRDAMINNGISSIQNSITSGFGDVQTALCGGFAGVNATVNGGLAGVNSAISNGFATAESSANARQMANMNQAFAAQTAMSQGFNGLQSQMSNCCCEQRLGLANLTSTILSENCADRAAISDGIRDIITNQTSNTQRILDKLCEQEIENLRERNLSLQNQVNMQNLAASQATQTAQLIADNTAQTQYIVNRVAPYPIPAYTVANPVTPATT